MKALIAASTSLLLLITSLAGLRSFLSHGNKNLLWNQHGSSLTIMNTLNKSVDEYILTGSPSKWEKR
jgi:hypothetical protein